MYKVWWSCRSFRSRQTLPTVHSLPPLASDVMQPGGWYLVHLERRAREKAISKFLQWIQSQV
ncbi:hypothetical protein SAMN03159448_05109 [Sinorhizobium sp. NFACC03]|nr:hypothetical protein SAMN03159448_05109 [Sinorhizobium sp. NFACC03]